MLVLVEGDDVDFQVLLHFLLGLLLHVVELVVVHKQRHEVALARQHLLVLALLSLHRGQLCLQLQDLLLVNGEVAFHFLDELQAGLQLLADLGLERVALHDELLQVQTDSLLHLGVGIGELGVVDLQQLLLQFLERGFLYEQAFFGYFLDDLRDDVLQVLEGLG